MVIVQGLLGNDLVTQGYGVAEAAPTVTGSVLVPMFGRGAQQPRRKKVDVEAERARRRNRDVDVAVAAMMLGER